MKSFLRNKSTLICLIVFYCFLIISQLFVTFGIRGLLQNACGESGIIDVIVGISGVITLIASLITLCLWKKKGCLATSMALLIISYLIFLFTGFYSTTTYAIKNDFPEYIIEGLVFCAGGIIPILFGSLFAGLYIKAIKDDKPHSVSKIVFLILTLLTTLFVTFMNTVLVKSMLIGINESAKDITPLIFSFVYLVFIILIYIFYGIHKFDLSEAPRIKKIKKPKPIKVKQVKEPKPKKVKPIKKSKPIVEESVPTTSPNSEDTKPVETKEIESKVQNIEENIEPEVALAATTEKPIAIEPEKVEETEPIIEEVPATEEKLVEEINHEPVKTNDAIEEKPIIETSSELESTNESINKEQNETKPEIQITNKLPTKILIRHPNTSPKKRYIAFMLCFLLGGFGAHRFYVGKIGTGILYLLTLGGFGLGTICDTLLLLASSFRDKEGKVLRDN